jgi:8-oxo-dGTP pyrophosphatase MutT (NUDIX family)
VTAPRPKDAATLILVRRGGDGLPSILMGRRASGHVFMPDKYVFPGDKVDACDRLVPVQDRFLPQTQAALLAYCKRRDTRAFGLAAVRETWEETGLIIGNHGQFSPKTQDEGWTSYAAMGAIPTLAPLHFIARAITPPMRTRRFDARFFLADADEALLDDRPPIDGAEMEDLRWFTYNDALDLDLPTVTRFVLGEVAARLKEPTFLHRPAFLRWTRKGHEMMRL